MSYFKIRHVLTESFLDDVSNIINDYNPSLGKYISKEGYSYDDSPTCGFMSRNGLNPTAFEIVEFENDLEINTKKFL